MISNEELAKLARPSRIRSSFALAVDWFLIGSLFWLAARFHSPIVWIFCFILAARQQLALAILMHDGAHRRLFVSTWWNDWICQIFCAAPLFFSMYSYQQLHLKHHRAPLAEDDPDLSLIGGYPISRSSFLRKIARDAFGISYFKFIRYFIYMARKPKADDKKKTSSSQNRARGKIPFAGVLSSMIVVNFLLASVLIASGHGWYYLFLWVLPAVTALQVLLRVRGIAEHAGYSANSDQRLNARTVINPIQTFLFAPHNVNFHIEHHIYPAVPFHNLRRLHRRFVEEELLPPANVYRGYGRILRELTSKPSA